jgi:hypothetical protein
MSGFVHNNRDQSHRPWWFTTEEVEDISIQLSAFRLSHAIKRRITSKKQPPLQLTPTSRGERRV